MKITLIPALALVLSSYSFAGVGTPHSDTAGPETTDIMGYGTPGGGGVDNELRTSDDKRNSVRRTESGVGATDTTGEKDKDIDGDRPGSRSRSDTESYDQQLRGEEAGTKRNSQQRMEERQNNANVIYDSDRKTSSDGIGVTEEDTRRQGEEYNQDTSDFEVEDSE